MAVYLLCKKCKTCFDVRLKKCPRCGELVPAQGKTYRIMIMVNRQMVTKTVPNSLELARQIEAKIKSELVAGEYYDRRKKIPTLDEVWHKYLDSYKTLGKAWAKEESRYNAMLKARFGDRRLDQINIMDIQRFVLDMRKTTNRRKRPYSPKTIKNTIELLSRLFNYARKMNMFDGDNPCKKINLPKISNEITNALDSNQIGNLLNVLNEYPDQETANLIKLLLFTGIRRGEAFKLRWEDVDLNNGWLYIRNPKGGKDQVIPLNNLALDVLKNQISFKRETTGLVFPNKKGQIRTDIKNAWAKVKKLAGLPDGFRLHDLRHTYATLLASSGRVDLYTLQRLLTHKSPQMTQRYAHLVEEALRKGTKTLEQIIRQDLSNIARADFAK